MGLILKNIFLAIPFYLLWNSLAPIYFTTWPQAFHQIPFFHCVGFMLLIAVLRMAMLPAESPKIMTKFSWSGMGGSGAGTKRRMNKDGVIDVN